MGGELKQAKDHIKSIDLMIQIIKAKGGWKYRNEIKLTDLQLKKRMQVVEIELRNMATNLATAETMLREPPPSIHNRWEEYQRRRAEAIVELGKR